MDEQKLQMNYSDRELLIRVDERVRSLQDQVTAIQVGLINPSEHRGLMTDRDDHEKRIKGIEDWRSKMIGFSAGLGAVSGGVTAGIFGMLTKLSGN